MLDIPFLKPGEQWPPKNDAERLRAYKIYEDYYRREASELLESKALEVREIILKFPNLISRAFSSLLFGEPLVVRFDAGDEERKKLALDWETISERSEWNALNFEQAFISSCIGDAFYKIHERQAGFVKVSMTPGSIVFVHTDPDDCREILAYVIAWLIDYPDGRLDKNGAKAKLLRAEIHEIGLITHKLFTMAETQKIGSQVAFADVFGESLPAGVIDGEVKTGVDDFMVHHVANNRWGAKTYGQSDMHGNATILRSIEDRAYKNKLILDDHAKPKMAVPPGVLDESGRVSRQTFDGMLFEVHPVPGTNGLLVPEYITWDGQLSSAQEDRDWLRDTFLMMTQIAPQLLNLSKDGGNAPSGTALRRMMLGTLAAVSQKRLSFWAPIRRTIKTAMALKKHRDFSLVTEWQDGLPPDPVESATVEQIRTGTKATTSQVDAIMRLDGVDRPTAEETIKRIQGESPQPDASGFASDLRDQLNFNTQMG